MALTDRQRKTIQESLKGRIGGPCPLCGQGNWTLGDEMVAAMATSVGGGIGIGGPFIPMVQLICNHCGFVSHHAVAVLGIKLQD